MNQYIKQYQKSSIETASREQILIMLYDGCIQFLNKAKYLLENDVKNVEEIHKNLVGAQNIIQEFINTLDHEVAPQLTANLESLYEYFLRRLVQANMKKDVKPVEEVLRLVKSLRDTWAKAVEISQKEAVSSLNDDDDEDEDEDEEYEG